MIAAASMPTVYGYCRVSTDMQDPDCAGQKLQIEERFRTQFQQQGCFWGGHFVDPGTSAKIPFLSRPEGSKSVRVMKANDILIIAKMDRAFRSIIDFGVTIALWKKMKLKILVLDFGMDATTEVGEFVAGIMVLVAQWERRRISNRIKESRAAAKQTGMVTGQREYGYRYFKKNSKKDGRWRQHREPWPEERALLVEIQELSDAGLSRTQIAAVLNQTSTLNRPDGKAWTKRMVQTALLANMRFQKMAEREEGNLG